MINWLKKLFPLNRSLTGEGTLKTLKFFKKINPELKIIRFKSGKKVFDWTIPHEWKITDAFIKHIKTKKKFAEFKKNNLHILNYSVGIDKVLDLNELKKKIYTLKKIPNAVPYVTSYYKRDWGFCLDYKTFKNLPKGKYRAYVNSEHCKGNLNLAHCVLKGKMKKEIFFSSYVCHPSMANNELSGPVLLNYILRYLKENYKSTKYSYRFVLLPETIGSIAYLSKHYKEMKKNIIAGYNLSCVGDGRMFSFVKSRIGNTITDKSLEASIITKKNYKIYNYSERGSDERQYCSPGIDLPVCNFSRSKYGTFKEYHNSLDNLNFVKEKHLQESFELIKNIITAFETGVYPIANFYCEPNLGKRGLYQNNSSNMKRNNQFKIRRDIISYSDGKHSLFDISINGKFKFEEVIKEYKNLLKHKVVNNKFI